MNAVAAALLTVGFAAAAIASDHRDAPRVNLAPQLDINDVYAFLPPDTDDVVFVLTINPLITPTTTPRLFDPKITYQIFIDTNANAKPDLSFTFRFKKPDGEGSQPVKLAATGFGGPLRGKGTTDTIITLPRDVQVFAGRRDDPFFFDQAGARNGLTFCGPGAADTFAGTDVGAIVIELPTSRIPANTLGVWAATRRGRRQSDRLGLPLINELVIGLNDKDKFNQLPPAKDERRFGDIVTSRLVTLGNDAGTAATLTDLILPDLLTISLDRPTAFPNGRRLGDDVVDTLLMQLLGKPTDCVDANDAAFLGTFPYLAPPHLPVTGTTSTTLPGGATLDLSYLHLAPGFSIVCGGVSTSPPLPGADATAGRGGPGGPLTTPFVLDGAGAGGFALPINTFDTYPITVTIQTGGAPIVLNDSVEVLEAQGTCPGATGRALLLGAGATSPFTPGDVLCLDRVAPGGACVGVGPECLSPLDQRAHLHGTMTVVGTPGGTFPDPASTACGHGLVVSGYPGCGPDTVPSCT